MKLLFLVPAPRVKPERQMKKMEHRSGTFFRDSSAYYSLWIVLRIVDRGTEEAAAQQQQHSSSGGSDVAATDEKDKRGYTGEPFFFRSCAFTQFEKDERGHTAKSLLTTAVLL